MARRSFISKQRMWLEQKELCYWCGRVTKFHKHIDGAPIPPDAVTVDHIYPANHPIRQRYKQRNEPSPFVIACFKCNNARGDILFEDYKLKAALQFHDDRSRTVMEEDRKLQTRLKLNKDIPARMKGFDNGRSKHRRRGRNNEK